MATFVPMRRTDGRKHSSGFTIMELCVTMAIAIVMTAVSVPVVGSVLRSYKMNAAVAGVNSGILKTRYRAIGAGYPFALVMNKANSTLQVQSDPTDKGIFANVGLPIPFSSATNVLGQNMTLVFRPGGAIQCPACAAGQTDAKGDWLITLSSTGVKTETLTVSPYGQITITP